jgi:hypothetical protein
MWLGKRGPNTPMCRKSNAGEALLFPLRSLYQRDHSARRIYGAHLACPATRCSARAGRKARSEISASPSADAIGGAKKQGRVMAWAAGGPTAGAESRCATRDKAF